MQHRLIVLGGSLLALADVGLNPMMGGRRDMYISELQRWGRSIPQSPFPTPLPSRWPPAIPQGAYGPRGRCSEKGREPGQADRCPQPPYLPLPYSSPAEDKTLSEGEQLLLQPSVCSQTEKYHQNNVFAKIEHAPARRRLPLTTVLSIWNFFPFASSWMRGFHKDSFYLPCLLWTLFLPLTLSCLLVYLQFTGPEVFYPFFF